jgi:hypothetical protein
MLFFLKFRPFCKKIQIKGLAENCSRTFLFQLARLNCVAKISATGTTLFGNRFSLAATCRAFGELLLAKKYYAVHNNRKFMGGFLNLIRWS